MKKSLLAVVCAAALCFAAALCGCSSDAGGTIIVNDPKQDVQEVTELSFFGYKADTLNLLAIEQTLHGFMDVNQDLNVIYEGAKNEVYWQALDKRNAAGVLDDIFMVDHDHVVEMSAENKLLDLSDILGEVSFRPKVAEQITSADGAVYFVPMSVSSFNLYVNSGLLEKYGMSVPQNYTEFSAVCDRFVSLGITPLVVNNSSSLRSLAAAKSLYDVYGSADEQSAIENFNKYPAALAGKYGDGIDMIAEMTSRGWIDAEEALGTQAASEDVQIFAQGQRPFMVTGSWASALLGNAAPDLRYGVYPLPVTEEGGVLVLDLNTCVSVNALGSDTKDAKKFISYIMQTEVLRDYSGGQSGYMPTEDGTLPSDKASAPLAEGGSVIGSDYRLNIPKLDAAVESACRKILRGEDAEEVKAYLSNALVTGVAEE